MDLEVVKALTNPANSIITPGIERVCQVLNHLNRPQDKYKVIHITGTNGKGSTAAFLETSLIHAGYKVGKFTTPHIFQINETITLNSQKILDKDLAEEYYNIKHIQKIYAIQLSPFELLTVIMFCYFAKNTIDYLILEVGMGGSSDATNVVNSIYSIITNISLEHTQYLGNSLIQIANEKCGIIKGGKTIIASNSYQLLEVLQTKTNNYINVINKYKFQVKLDLVNFKTIIKFANNQEYSLNLFGKFQAYNFLCAYAVLKDLNVSEKSITYAATNTKWPFRLK